VTAGPRVAVAEADSATLLDGGPQLLGHGVERRCHRRAEGPGEPVHQPLEQGTLPFVDGTATEHRSCGEQPASDVLDEDRTPAEVVQQLRAIGPS
jgi:hypothetical protein